MDLEGLSLKYEKKYGVVRTRRAGQAAMREIGIPINPKAVELAERTSAVAMTLNKLRVALELRGRQFGLLYLGKDEHGTMYRASVSNKLRCVMFDAVDPVDYRVKQLGAEIFRTEYTNHNGTLCFDVETGNPSWRGERQFYFVDGQDIFNTAETSIKKNEETSQMLMTAATDPVLNPNVAERLRALQQQ